MQSYSDIIRRWPSRSELATDCRVDYGVVKQWERRNSIPPAYWASIAAAAERRGIKGVTAETLAELAAKTAQGRPDEQKAGAA